MRRKIKQTSKHDTFYATEINFWSMNILHTGQFLRLVRAGRWEFVERVGCEGAAAVIAFTREKALVLIRQFRPPVGAHAIELPAGLVGDEAHLAEEDFATAAARELEEETGYRAHELTLIGKGPTTPGLSSETVHLYLAREVSRVSAGGGVGHEAIEVFTVPIGGLDAWLAERTAAGDVIDLKVHIARAYAGP